VNIAKICSVQASQSPLWRVLPYINRHGLRYWPGLALLCSSRLIEAIIPLYLKVGIDRLAAHDGRLAGPTLMILALTGVRYAAFNVGRKTLRKVSAQVAFELRQELYWRLQLQGPGFFSRFPTGDLMARAISDIALVREFVSAGIRALFLVGFTSIAAFAFMSQQSGVLTLLLLPAIPALALGAWGLARKMLRQSQLVQEGFSDLCSQVQENLNGVRTIQAHAQEHREIARFTEESSRYSDAYFLFMQLRSALNAWMAIGAGVITLIIVGFGGSLVLDGVITLGAFTAFLFYLSMLLAMVKESANLITQVQRGSSSAKRLFEVLHHEPEIQDAPDAAPLGAVHGAISVRNLTFRYGERPAALDDLSLQIDAGETIAILGRVGSGKTTLLRLLTRMLDPAPGTIFLDGRDVRGLPLAQLRKSVALTPQDPFLFAAAMGENIAYADPRRPEAHIWDAAEAASLGPTIRRFSKGLETLVGERGVTLSGGQKQRTALARALIREAPVLLLDDCFSSVDTETEEFILKRLKALRAGRTTIMVSHRVSTARHADRIIVLKDGRIAEMGTHQHLMAVDGAYAGLARLQGSQAETAIDTEAAE
jgi:ATP-binding cassette, subfamily B, multidrug efflux pump